MHVRTASPSEVIDDSDTQGRSFFGIGAGTDFIEQDQRRRFAYFDHPSDVRHM